MNTLNGYVELSIKCVCLTIEYKSELCRIEVARKNVSC